MSKEFSKQLLHKIEVIAIVLGITLLILSCVIGSNDKWKQECKDYGGVPMRDFSGVESCVGAKLKEIKWGDYARE